MYSETNHGGETGLRALQGRNLVERLNEIGRSLSASNSKISAFLLMSGHGAAFLTAADIAASVGVSESTVVRFARLLGFRGFPELQQFLRAGLLQSLSPTERVHAYDDIRDDTQLVARITEIELLNLRTTLQQADMVALRALTESICKARRCYVIGLRSSRGVATLLGHYLTKFIPHVTTITSGDFMPEELSWANAQDLLIAFSFPRYSEGTVEAIRIARRAGARTAAITDSTGSPAAQLSDERLIVPASSGFFGNSFVGAVAMTNLLLAFCTRAQPEAVRESLARVESAAALDRRFVDAPGQPAAGE
jgi:DNA-binding MurR/RpiR family transcriptional regulator